jgi:hypothetical protein
VGGLTDEGIRYYYEKLTKDPVERVFILVGQSEDAHITGFYDRAVMTQFKADNMNKELSTTVWVLQPND